MISRSTQAQYDSGAGTGKVHIGHTYLRLLRYAMPYKHQVVAVLLLSVVSSFISVLPVQVLGVAVDEIKNHVGATLEVVQQRRAGVNPAPTRETGLRRRGGFHARPFRRRGAGEQGRGRAAGRRRRRRRGIPQSAFRNPQ